MFVSRRRWSREAIKSLTLEDRSTHTNTTAGACLFLRSSTEGRGRDTAFFFFSFTSVLFLLIVVLFLIHIFSRLSLSFPVDFAFFVSFGMSLVSLIIGIAFGSLSFLYSVLLFSLLLFPFICLSFFLVLRFCTSLFLLFSHPSSSVWCMRLNKERKGENYINKNNKNKI